MSAVRFAGIVLCVLLLHGASAPAARAAASGSDCPSCIADFALYDPSYEDDGVWEEEVTALKTMFKDYGFSYKLVNSKQVNQGYLGSGSKRKFRALIEPGGWAWYRNVMVGSSGESSIRNFVNGGGNYVGFCAGAYYAVKTVSWDNDGTGKYESYPYDLQLFNGTGKGPFEWMPWENGTNINYVIAAINTSNSTMATIGLPATTRFVYGGGPWFIPSKSLSGYEVWARAKAPQGRSGADGDGEPAIIKYNYGKGKVILFSWHPEILIHSMVDGVKLSRYYNEDAVDWDTGSQSFDQINLDSWNIVHAALQIAAKQKVTKISKLPGE